MKLLVVLLTIAVTAMGSIDDGLKCIPLASFMIDCNECSCAINGKGAFCTYKDCRPFRGLITYLRLSDEPIPANTQVCTPHSTFKIRCNECRCNENGTTYQCTELACDEEVPDFDGSVTALSASTGVSNPGSNDDDISCIPSARFMLDCNYCSCAVNGKGALCTHKVCHQNRGLITYLRLIYQLVPANTQMCKPHSIFKIRCNECRCNENGTTFECTKLVCDEEAPNIDGSVTVIPTTSVVIRSIKQVCKPLSRFKHECNTCACSMDGTRSYCTKKGCNLMILPDGSIQVKPRPNQETKSGNESITTH